MYLYVIFNEEHYKIGISKQPERRLKQLQTGCAVSIKLIKTYKIPDSYARKIEKQVHRMFWQRQLKGEWFDLTEAHLDVLDQWIKQFNIN
jgi:hypothetical protein